MNKPRSFDCLNWHFKAIEAQYRIRDLDAAIDCYTKALEVDPTYDRAYHNRGRIYIEKGEFDEALSDINRAIEINPDYAKAYHSRAIVYFFKLEYDKSWQDIYTAEMLGYKIVPKFLEDLKIASGKER